MSSHPRLIRALVAPLLLLAAACTDRSPLTPEVPTPVNNAARVECRVTVATATMVCTSPGPETPGGVNAVITGNQNVYVRLASSGTSYDSGTEILQSNVTVQNLLKVAMGTPDGVTVDGVRVFFASGPTVTSGTGTVAVANEDGTGTFTASGQEFFLYNEILSPFEISGSRNWQFSVPATVATFSFTLYVSASLTDETARLGPVWDGEVSTVWSLAANWKGNVAPTATDIVTIPVPDSIPSGNYPVLDVDTVVAGLRVAPGSTLDLSTFTLRVNGNVDASGTISGSGAGTLWLAGAGSVVNGNVPSVRVTSGVSLQGAVKATGALNVSDGSLNVSTTPFSISVP